MAMLTANELAVLRIISQEPLESSPAHDRYWTQLVALCRDGIHGAHPVDAEQLAALGLPNLQHIRAFYQTAFDALNEKAIEYQNYLDNFKLTGQDIATAAAKSQDCNLIAHWHENIIDGLVPQCPIETIPIQRATTTFRNCGWCTHAIATSTEFHSNAKTKGYCQFFGPDLLRFNSCKSPCYLTDLTHLSPHLITGRIEHHRSILEQQLRKAEQLQASIHERLDSLDELIKQAPKDRPLYSHWRKLDWLGLPTTAVQTPTQNFSTTPHEKWRGREVVCFLKLDGGSYITTHGFVQDVTFEGENPDQCVVYVRCELRPGYYPESAFPFKLRDCTLFTRAEFDYFFQHQDDFRKWALENRNNRDQPNPNEINSLAQALFYSGGV